MKTIPETKETLTHFGMRSMWLRARTAAELKEIYKAGCKRIGWVPSKTDLNTTRLGFVNQILKLEESNYDNEGNLIVSK